jgi:seryl-tRNA synthetase
MSEDLLSEELDEVVDPADTTEPTPEIQYTKTGRVKVNRPRTQAQIDAFAKARARWEEMRRESTELKKQATLKSSEVTLQKKQQDAEAEAKIKVDRAVKKYQKQKEKLIKNDPLPELPEDKEPELPSPPVEEEPVPDTPPSPVKIKKTRKKKPVIIVQESDDSELESDDTNVIFVKKKSARPKEPVPDPRFKPAQSNPFARNYFYSPTAMS